MKNVVMTGATSGIGKSWLLHMVESFSMNYYLLARNESKVNDLLELVSPNKRCSIIYIHCDLSSLESINNAASSIKQKISHIDILIHNAGYFPESYQLTQDYIEKTFAINVIAPYILTNLFIDLLKKSTQAKVISTSSFQHLKAKEIKIRDHNNFHAMKVYQESKLYLTMISYYFSKFFSEFNINFACLDPGIVDTEMTITATNTNPIHKFFYPLIKKVSKTPLQAAQTGIYLCENSTQVSNGRYYKNKKIVNENKLVFDQKAQDKLIRILENYRY